MKKLLKFLSGYKLKLFGIHHKMINTGFLGHNLNVVKGTLRNEPDKDDAWLFHLMGKFDQIFDIGANIGQTAIFAKVQGKNKKILLADPNPEALSLAAKNLIMNGFSQNCTFIPAFVSDKENEQVELFTIGAGAAGSMYKGHAHTAAAVGTSIMTSTTTMDKLALMAGWLPDFVKIDVEGAEAKVLQGAKKIASQQKTWFMVEMHSPPELPMVENAKQVLKWTNEVGYKAWYMRDGIELTTPDIISDRGRCHLLLMPNEISYPNELKVLRQSSSIQLI